MAGQGFGSGCVAQSGIGLLKLGRSRQLAIAQFVHLLCEEGHIGDVPELIDCGEGTPSVVGKQVIAAIQCQNAAQIDFEKLFRDRTRASPIESPLGAIGQNAPAELAAGQIIDPAQITQHLCGRCRGFVPARRTIQRTRPALAFDDGQPVGIPLPLIAMRIGGGFGFGISKQQAVRHIIAPANRQVLLAERFSPAKRAQNRPDEIILGLALVRLVALRKGGSNALNFLAQVREVNCGISRITPDRFDKIVSGKQGTRYEKR